MGEDSVKSPLLKWAWNCAKFGLLTLPLFPLLGEVGLLSAIILTFKERYRQIIKYPLNWGLAILSIWLIITCFQADRPTEAFLGLANFLPFMLLLASFSVLIQKPSQLRQLARAIAIPSIVVVILGLGQLFGGWRTPNLFLGWELVANGNPEGRMASVFMYTNILAVYLSIAFVLGLGLWIDIFVSRKNKNKDISYLLLLSLAVIADGVGLILTSSRNAWAIAVFSCVAFAIYLGWRWLVVAFFTACASILGASFGPSPTREWLREIVPAYFWARLSDELYPDRPIATLRTTQWQFCWEMTQQRPWMGWGLRNFTPLYKAKMGLWLGHPHNLFLMLMAETGILATLFLCVSIGWIFFRAVILLSIWSRVKSNNKLRSNTVSIESETYSKKNRLRRSRDKLILFTYLLAFGSCVLFNLLDVTIYDLRVNTLGWVLLSAISGIVYSYRKIVIEK